MATISRGLGIYHQDLVADQNVVIAAPFRIDRSRRPLEAGDSGTRAEWRVPIEIEKLTLLAGCRRARPDHRGEFFGALFGRELRSGAGWPVVCLREIACPVLVSAFILVLSRPSRPSAFIWCCRAFRDSPRSSWCCRDLHGLRLHVVVSAFAAFRPSCSLRSWSRSASSYAFDF